MSEVQPTELKRAAPNNTNGASSSKADDFSLCGDGIKIKPLPVKLDSVVIKNLPKKVERLDIKSLSTYSSKPSPPKSPKPVVKKASPPKSPKPVVERHTHQNHQNQW